MSESLISAGSAKIERQQRRVEGLIDEFERIAKQAEELGDRVTSLLDRTGGNRPQPTENTAGAPQPVPNGHLEALDSAIRRISNAHEHIRAELGSLEQLL